MDGPNIQSSDNNSIPKAPQNQQTQQNRFCCLSNAAAIKSKRNEEINTDPIVLTEIDIK